VSADRPWEDFTDPLTASAPPAAVAPSEAPVGPWSNYTDPIASPAPQGPPVPTVAKGNFLPISKDAAGNYSFDPSAGVTGDFGRATTLPGRVMSGETQMPSTFDPRANDPRANSMIGEAINFGSFFGPRNPMVRSGDLPIPGEKRTAPDLTKAVTPTSRQLQDMGSSQFGEYRASNQIYPSDTIEKLVSDMKASLTSKGQYAMAGSAPVTHNAIDVLLAKAKTGPFVTAADMDELRQALSTASKKGESGAMQARSELFQHLEDTGDKTMRNAVQNYGAGKRGEIVDTILRKSANASDPDRALTNLTRSQAETMRTRPRGFTEGEIGALDAAREGSSTVRGLEGGANLLTGNTLPSIMGRGVPIASGAGALGFSLGGPVGAAIGAATPGAIAGGMKIGAGALRRGAVEDASQLVRQRSPLFRDQVNSQDLVPTMTGRDAIANALLRMQMQQRPPAPEKYDPENYT
jgi:hypothetical protein